MSATALIAAVAALFARAAVEIAGGLVVIAALGVLGAALCTRHRRRRSWTDRDTTEERRAEAVWPGTRDQVLGQHRHQPDAPASPTVGGMSGVRTVFLSVLALDLALIAAAVITRPPFLNQPGSAVYLAEPVVLVVAYAAIVLVALRPRAPEQQRILTTAAVVGLATGTMEIINISMETFTNLAGAAHLASTAAFILGPFLVWGGVGGWATRATGSPRAGVLAAVWTAMVTMIVGVSYGFVLAVAVPARLAIILATDPDFSRSGWSDVHAFVLANTFDNGFTHLLGGLIVGSIMGLIGTTIGRWRPGTRVARPVNGPV